MSKKNRFVDRLFRLLKELVILGEDLFVEVWPLPMNKKKAYRFFREGVRAQEKGKYPDLLGTSTLWI